MNIPKIYGSGGGKGDDAHVPVESPNTLQSKTYIRILDLLGYGEWEGLVNGGKSIYFDDTPLFDSSGTGNFTGFQWGITPGTQSQSYQSGFDTVENYVSVSTKLRKTNPTVSRLITNPNIDRLVINYRISYLYSQWTNGDMKGAYLSFRILVSGVEYAVITHNDKTTSPYLGSREIVLPGAGSVSSWTITLELLPDTGNDAARKKGTKIQSELYWDSYSEVTTRKLAYPNCVIAALEMDSENFGSVPTRGYHVKMAKIKVPVNYNPLTRAYATSGAGTTNGGWDGTFKVAWTNNPAWVFYDLVTNKNIGIGQYADASNIDKWSLYEIAKYCDRMVPDGKGGTEPLFTCNMYLQTQEEALRVLNDLASCFRSMIYYHNGKIVAIQDRPKSPQHLFNQANVVNGKFSYTSTSKKSRKTVAVVRYNDPTNFYRPSVEIVEDYEGILRYGYQEADVAAFACTSRAQARRLGIYLLETEKRESEVVNWRTGTEALTLKLGDIVSIHDATRVTIRYGGRLLAGTTSSNLILDNSFNIVAGKTYTVSVYMPKDTIEPEDIQNSTQATTARPVQFETRTITSAPGTISTIAMSPALSTAPATGSIWVVTASDVAPQSIRLLSIKEVDNGVYELEGNVYDPQKFDATEVDPNYPPAPTFFYPLDQSVTAPTNIKSILRVVVTPEGVERYLDLSWENADSYATKFKVTYTLNQQVFSLADVYMASVTIKIAESGNYSFQIAAIRPFVNSTSKAVNYTIIIADQPPGTYTIGTGGAIVIDPVDPSITSAVLYRVTGLELANGIRSNAFANPSAKFTWRINTSLASSNLGTEQYGAVEQGVADAYFSHYLIMIKDAQGKVLFSDKTTTPEYEFTYDRNMEITKGVPLRSFTFAVVAFDKYYIKSEEAYLTVSNPQVTNVVANHTVKTGGATVTAGSNESDVAGYICYAAYGTASPEIIPANLKYVGQSNVFDLDFTSVAPITYIVAGFDLFGRDSLKFTAPQTFTPLAPFANPPEIYSLGNILGSYATNKSGNVFWLRDPGGVPSYTTELGTKGKYFRIYDNSHYESYPIAVPYYGGQLNFGFDFMDPRLGLFTLYQNHIPLVSYIGGDYRKYPDPNNGYYWTGYEGGTYYNSASRVNIYNIPKDWAADSLRYNLCITSLRLTTNIKPTGQFSFYVANGKMVSTQQLKYLDPEKYVKYTQVSATQHVWDITIPIDLLKSPWIAAVSEYSNAVGLVINYSNAVSTEIVRGKLEVFGISTDSLAYYYPASGYDPDQNSGFAIGIPSYTPETRVAQSFWVPRGYYIDYWTEKVGYRRSIATIVNEAGVIAASQTATRSISVKNKIAAVSSGSALLTQETESLRVSAVTETANITIRGFTGYTEASTLQEPNLFRKRHISGNMIMATYQTSNGTTPTNCISRSVWNWSGVAEFSNLQTGPAFLSYVQGTVTGYGDGDIFSTTDTCSTVTSPTSAPNPETYFGYAGTGATCAEVGAGSLKTVYTDLTGSTTGCAGYFGVSNIFHNWNGLRTFQETNVQEYVSTPVDYLEIMSSLADEDKQFDVDRCYSKLPASIPVLSPKSQYDFSAQVSLGIIRLSFTGSALADYELKLFFSNFAADDTPEAPTTVTLVFQTDSDGIWADEITVPMPAAGKMRSFNNEYKITRI